MSRRIQRTPVNPNRDQLQLALGMPWNGVSPRYLTGAHERFSLVAGGDDPADPEADGTQLELFPEGTSYGT